MTFRGWLITLALVIPVMVIPVMVQAQGQRGGGGRGGDPSEMSEDGPLDNGIKSKDVLKQDPATLLIAKAKDLKLDDTQRTHLVDIAKRYDWNANVFARVADSLQNIIDSRRSGSSRGGRRGGSSRGASSDSARSPDEILAARKTLQATLLNIRTEYDTAASRSLKALTDAQRPKATSILDKPSKDLADLLRRAGGP